MGHNSANPPALSSLDSLLQSWQPEQECQQSYVLPGRGLSQDSKQSPAWSRLQSSQSTSSWVVDQWLEPTRRTLEWGLRGERNPRVGALGHGITPALVFFPSVARDRVNEDVYSGPLLEHSGGRCVVGPLNDNTRLLWRRCKSWRRGRRKRMCSYTVAESGRWTMRVNRAGRVGKGRVGKASWSVHLELSGTGVLASVCKSKHKA